MPAVDNGFDAVSNLRRAALTGSRVAAVSQTRSADAARGRLDVIRESIKQELDPSRPSLATVLVASLVQPIAAPLIRLDDLAAHAFA
jgi:hypothetical protein